MGIRAYQRVNIGLESTAGTAVAATKQWRGVGQMLDDQRTLMFVDELNAIPVPTNRTYIPKLLAGLSLAETEATFEQLPYILAAGMKNVSTGVQDGAGTGYVYAYDAAVGSTLNSIRTYTIETGDDQQAEEAEYCFCTDFNIKGTAGEAVKMSANFVGRRVTNTTFSSISLINVEEILAGLGVVYADDEGGTIGTTQLSNSVLNFDLSVTTGWKPKFFIDGNALYFGIHYFDMSAYQATLKLTFEHDSTAVAAKTNWRNEVGKLIRLQFAGSALGTSGTYTTKILRMDMTGKYSKFEPLSDQEGNDILVATFEAKYSPTDADSPLAITVVNENSTLFT